VPTRFATRPASKPPLPDDIAARAAVGLGEPRPPLSVVIPVREGLAEIAAVLEALVLAAGQSGAELVVVGELGEAEPPAEPVRLVPFPVADMLALRRRGLIEARGELVAIGEDHAVPRPGWCEAVIRAHAEHPEAAAVVGCLVNATDATLSGRANFLAFAASWQPPMATLPADRPPPSSTLSLKRTALAGIEAEGPGWFEADLIPSLFAEGRMVADARVVVDHYQDHGSLWSIRNAYDSARASYDYERSRLGPARRREFARWALANIPGRLRREAREAAGAAGMPVAERALISLIAAAAGIGGAAGTMRGPGRSADRVA
jgi:hypothetical protein